MSPIPIKVRVLNTSNIRKKVLYAPLHPGLGVSGKCMRAENCIYCLGQGEDKCMGHGL